MQPKSSGAGSSGFWLEVWLQYSSITSTITNFAACLLPMLLMLWVSLVHDVAAIGVCLECQNEFGGRLKLKTCRGTGRVCVMHRVGIGTCAAIGRPSTGIRPACVGIINVPIPCGVGGATIWIDRYRCTCRRPAS